MKFYSTIFFLLVSFFCTQKNFASEVNFSEHIAPVIYKHCSGCHRPGEIAPFPLISYNDVKSYSLSIAASVRSGAMPPWMPAHGYGDFSDVRKLSEEEIQRISEWAEQGAPEGDPAKAPDPPKFSSGSQLGIPDLVLKMSEAFTIQGDNKDVYRNFVLSTNFIAGRNIRAIEFRPGNAKIVHHALIFLDPKHEGRKLDSAESGPGYSGFGGPGFDPEKNLLGWVPGAVPRFFPQNVGFSIGKDADIVLQIHYAPSETEETDQSSINIFFANDPVIREIQQSTIAPKNLSVPFVISAGQKKKFTGVLNVPADVSLIMIAPHMHLLGTEAKSYTVAPDGDTIPLIWIRKWDFHWQGYYVYRHLLKIPKGSKIYYEAEYDNTAENPNHPTPDNLKDVRWGESTFDEMFLSYFFWLPYRNGDENISTETATSAEENFFPGNVLQILVMPNPSSDKTKISFYLPEENFVTIELFDLDGRKTFSLVKEKIFASGENIVEFDAKEFPAGHYFVKISSGKNSVVKNFSVVK